MAHGHVYNISPHVDVRTLKSPLTPPLINIYHLYTITLHFSIIHRIFNIFNENRIQAILHVMEYISPLFHDDLKPSSNPS